MVIFYTSVIKCHEEAVTASSEKNGMEQYWKDPLPVYPVLSYFTKNTQSETRRFYDCHTQQKTTTSMLGYNRIEGNREIKRSIYSNWESVTT